MALRLTICACLIFSTVCHAAVCKSTRPGAVAAFPKIMVKTFAFAVTGGVTATPSTITFSSPDPDFTPVNGNSTATISWSMNGLLNSWSLTVNAASSSFHSCPSVPLSAIQFQCTSATAGLLGNATCATGTRTLSTSPQTIASGTAQGSGLSPFSVVVSFTFTDAWNYPANSSCTLNLTYTASGN